MPHPLSAVVASQVAEDYINGNISDVKKVFTGLKGANAAYLAIVVYRGLSDEKAAAFAKLVGSWAD